MSVLFWQVQEDDAMSRWVMGTLIHHYLFNIPCNRLRNCRVCQIPWPMIVYVCVSHCSWQWDFILSCLLKQKAFGQFVQQSYYVFVCELWALLPFIGADIWWPHPEGVKSIPKQDHLEDQKVIFKDQPLRGHCCKSLWQCTWCCGGQCQRDWKVHRCQVLD